MKNFSLTITILLFLAVQVCAQTPNAISYQGVARNASGLVLPNQLIGLRFTVHQGSAGGTTVYQETQTTTTNLLGLFTVSVGNGTVTNGVFTGIPWGNGPIYLQVEMDPTGGNSYVNMGTNQFLSVPYALNSGTSNTSWNISGNANTTGTNYIGTSDGNDLVFKANNSEVMRIANATGNVGIGTSTPNAGAALDVSSTTKGMIIPRLSANPASPANGMMYYNTSTNCIMLYTNNFWDAVACPCPNTPGTPAQPVYTPTGLTNSSVCPSTAGLVFSVPAVSNASSYTWTITNGTINSGISTNVISVTSATSSLTLKVAAVNNCSTGTASATSTFPLVTVPAISTPPAANVYANAGNNATFSVTATNSPTYQWQVNTGTGYSSIPGATSNTYTASAVTTGMNGYLYNVLVTGPCGTLTSTASTLTVCAGNPSATGAISGPASFCTSTAGLVFTVPVSTNATTYNWTVPAGTITAGSNTNSITVTSSATSGTYTITAVASNACTTAASSTYTVVNNAATAITAQPINAAGGTANFSVTASGGSLTYQWMLSATGTGGTFSAVPNSSPYSNTTSSTLTINPTTGLSGYAYKVVVGSSCGSSLTSNAATLSICTPPASLSVPITIHNSAGTATSANLSVEISPLNFSTFAGNENANLNNIEFSIGGTIGNGGTPLYAWIESGSAASSTSATPATSSSTAGIVWVNMGSNTIAGGASATIYMNFIGSAVMTGTTSYTGMAPQLTSTYGQYDNGALVFPTFYDNFAGNTLSAKWANNYNTANGVTTVNNGLSLSVPATGNEAAVISSANIFTPPVVAESYVNSPPNQGALRSYMPGLVSLTAAAAGALEGSNLADNYPNPPYDSYVCFSDGRAFGTYSWLQSSTTASSPYADYDIYSTAPTGYNVFGLYYNPTANSLHKNYSLACNGTAAYSPAANTKMYFTLGNSESVGGTAISLMSYWARVRVYPPSGTEPTATVGSLGCN